MATAETLVIKLVNNNVSKNNNTIPAEASGGRAICSMKYCAWPPSTMALPKATERMSRA